MEPPDRMSWRFSAFFISLQEYFPPAKEQPLFDELIRLSQLHRHYLMLYVGYLHTDEHGQYVNVAKCIAPFFDEEQQLAYYRVLCLEQKKEPVSFARGNSSAQTISEAAGKSGAIPLGMIFLVVFCMQIFERILIT